jgi:hypothetical protein
MHMSNSTRNDAAAEWLAEENARDALEAIPDATLPVVYDEVAAVVARIGRGTDWEAHDFLEHAVLFRIKAEQERRREAREAARVLIESNGHEARVEQLAEPDRFGATVRLTCSCGQQLGRYESYHADAQAVIADHVRRHRGRLLASA